MKIYSRMKNSAVTGLVATMLVVIVALVAVLPANAAAAADYAAVFDAAYYAEKYADLKAAFGNDEAALFNHFITCGMAEGRQGNAEFNVQVYKDRYPDLQAVYGDDLVSYYMHYIICGKAEGRTAVAATAQNNSSANAGGSSDTSIRNGWDVGMAYQIFACENMQRENAGMKLLLWMDNMTIPAQLRARELATNYTNNSSEDGYKENIARNCNDVAEVLDGSNAVGPGWMATTATRMNIMDERYRYTAVGVYVDANGVKYTVQLFDIPADMK